MVRDHGSTLDHAKIADYLRQKCTARGITVSRGAFANEEVKKRAAVDYDQAILVSATDRIPFEDAWHAVLALVATLPLPE